MEGQIRARELCFVVLVVEDAVLTEASREDSRNLRDERPRLPSKGERDAEALAHSCLMGRAKLDTAPRL